MCVLVQYDSRTRGHIRKLQNKSMHACTPICTFIYIYVLLVHPRCTQADNKRMCTLYCTYIHYRYTQIYVVLFRIICDFRFDVGCDV